MTINEEISKFRSGLSYSEFKNLFINSTAVKQNPSLMGQVDSYWNFYNKKEPTAPQQTSTLKGAGFYNIQDLGQNVSSYNSTSDIIQPSKIAETIQSVASGFFGKDGSIVGGIKNLGGQLLTSAMSGAQDILTKEVDLRNTINSQIGMAGDLSRDYRNEIFDALPGVVRMGYGFDDLKKTVVETMEQTGRFSLMNSKTMSDMAVTSRAFVGDLQDMAGIFRNFEEVGIGASDALEKINNAGKSSAELGLRAKTVVAETNKNLSKINEYGFQNGVQGLTRMVQKAVEFRMSMETAFKVADDMMDPDKAIALSAELQAIGGAIGDFNDPLKLMYMATNDVEGLQDALIGVAGSLATYNEEQGRFEITGVNLRKAKAMAAELGISYQELAKGAVAAAERSSAASALLTSGLQIDDKEKEFLTNISRMEGGSMVIDVPESLAKKLGLDESRVALEDLSQSQADAILENQKYFEKLSPEEMAKEQYTATQNLALTVSEISTMLKVEFARATRQPLSNVDKYINDVSSYLSGGDDKKGNKFTAELDRIKGSEMSKTADDYLRKDMGLQNGQPTSSQPAEKKIVLEVKAGDVTQDNLARGLYSDPVFQDNIKQTLLGEYTTQ